MSADAQAAERFSPRAAAMRVLYVAADPRGVEPLARALAGEEGPGVDFASAGHSAEALARLSDEAFDAVLIHHDGDVLDAVACATGVRSAGCDTPIVVVGDAEPGDFDADCYEAGAGAYCSLSQTTPRSLLATLRRAIDQARVAREYRRLVDADRRRLSEDHREAELLLSEQRRLVEQLERLDGADFATSLRLGPNAGGVGDGDKPSDATGALADSYRELLEAYVVMGAGDLSTPMAAMADRLVDAGRTGQEAIGLHVRVLEQVVAGLGARSARHVMNRADLLLVELMAYLVDGYRRRYDSLVEEPRRLA